MWVLSGFVQGRQQGRHRHIGAGDLDLEKMIYLHAQQMLMANSAGCICCAMEGAHESRDGYILIFDRKSLSSAQNASGSGSPWSVPSSRKNRLGSLATSYRASPWAYGTT